MSRTEILAFITNLDIATWHQYDHGELSDSEWRFVRIGPQE